MKKERKKSSIVTTVQSVGKTTKDTGKFALDKIKEIPNLPWKQLPATGWLTLILMALIMIAALIFGLYFFS